MTRVDISADLNSEDETGFVWTFLDEAEDPSIILPGEVVVAGSPLTPAVCEVVDLVEKSMGTIVHLRLLPGTIEQPPAYRIGATMRIDLVVDLCVRSSCASGDVQPARRTTA